MKNESAVGILYKNGKALVECRHAHEKFYPNGVLFPGGVVEDGESIEQGLVREMKEELGVTIQKYSFLSSHQYEDGHINHFFVVTQWDGEPQALEAASVRWIDNAQEITEPKNREIFELLKLKMP